jgi:tetratricopeptide (TPR) repeat protein
VLASGPRDAPSRQRTLQATIDWSYGLLNEEEQRLLAGLSVFAGGCTLEAAEAVCDAELDTLEGLVDRSLVRADGGRYRMLQTLREYALDKLARSGQEDLIRRRHAQWCIELIEPYGLYSYRGAEPGRGRLSLAVQEHENFRAALEWAGREGEIETVARVAAPLTPAWTEQGRLSEAGRWLGVARERSTELPLSLQATVLSAARVLACELGAHEESGDLCDQAIAIYRELGDVGAIVRETISRSAAAADDRRRSRALLAETLRFAREHDLPRARPHVLAHLAMSYQLEGRLDRARALYERALALASNESPGLCTVIRVDLAHLANLERRHTDAAELAQEVLEQTRVIGLRRTGTVAALEFAWSLTELHQPERATRILGAALEFYRDGGTFMQSDEVESEQAIRDALGAKLDERTFQALLDEGRGMTVEQAVRMAQERIEQPA